MDDATNAEGGANLGHEVAAGALAGAMAATLPPPVAEVVASAAYPVLLRLTRKVADEWNDIRHLRAVRAIQVATEEAGLTDVGFATRLRERPELLDLAGQAAQAAADSRYDARVKAVGVALAEGSLRSDDATLDTEFFLVSALAALDVPHVRLLDFIARNAPLNQGAALLSHELIEQAVPPLATVYDLLVEVLRRHGLIRAVPEIRRGLGVAGHESFSTFEYTYLTAFGDEVLQRLKDVGMEEIRGRNRAPLLH